MDTSARVEGERPRIYAASLADYNAGTLHGRWIYADEGAEHIHAQVAEMLAKSEEEVAEEWAIHDYEGFGSVRLSEYEDLIKVSELGSLIGEHGIVFAELAANFGGISGIEEAKRYMEEGYCGAFDTLEDYAREIVVDTYGAEIVSLPGIVRDHIDYEGIGRDMELSGDVFTIEHDHKVHVFQGNV